MYRIIELSTLLPRECMEYFSVPPNSKKKKRIEECKFYDIFICEIEVNISLGSHYQITIC